MLDRATVTARVLVIGDAMIDRYKTCRMDRISPEAPVPVLSYVEKFERLGGAANMAAGAAAMGADCDILTLTGEDKERDQLAEMLAQAGVGAHLEPVADHPTVVKERFMVMNQQVCRVDYERRFGPGHSAALMRRAIPKLDDYGLVVVSDYNKGVTQSLQDLMSVVRTRDTDPDQSSVRVLVDPKHADWSLYAGAYLIKPNWKEFQESARHERLLASGETISGDDQDRIGRIGQQMMSRHQITHLVVTMGSEGYVHINSDGHIAAHPTCAREVYDLSGAGDTFLATMTAFLAQGAALDVAIAQGNAAAGLAVGRVGTSVINRQDLQLDEALGSSDSSEVRVVRLLHSLAAQGQKIVFTNGCFDILHPGHLAILRQAKAAGDILVVGVNADSSVTRLKGPSRPVVPLQDRMVMLEGIEPVDFVLSFEEDTPERLIREIMPDVLVKGGDYTIETIVGADIVRENGGEVLIVPIVEGRSSSNIISRSRVS